MKSTAVLMSKSQALRDMILDSNPHAAILGGLLRRKAVQGLQLCRICEVISA